jgi:hypothetical protein
MGVCVWGGGGDNMAWWRLLLTPSRHVTVGVAWLIACLIKRLITLSLDPLS